MKNAIKKQSWCTSALKISIIIMLLCVNNTTVFAYDFYQKYRGNTLYFNKLEGNKVELTYKEYSNNNYKKLKTLYIPTTVSDGDSTYKVIAIGESAFSGAKNLREVIFEKEDEIDYIGEGAFAGCDMLQGFDIPVRVTEIAPYTFAWSGIRYIEMEDWVTKIGERAFTNCRNLSEMILSRRLKSIDNFAFAWCDQLESFTIPNTITHIGYEILQACSNIDTIRYFATDCETSGSYYNKAEERMVGGFESNSSLKYVEISNNVQTIPAYLLYNCKLISNIDVPKSVKRINEYALHYTGWYNYHPDGMIYVNNIAYAYKGSVENGRCSIADSITIIAPFCFFGKDLQKINLSDNLKYIGKSAFESSEIISITFPESLEWIEERAFADCKELNEINFNSRLDSVCGYAFSNCQNLKQVELPCQMSYLGEGAFYRCEYLSSAILPNSLEMIEPGIFSRCINLQRVVLPNNVKEIREYAFAGCTRLDSVSIPPECKLIGYKAFTHCSSLNKIEFNNNEYDIGSLAFYRCESLWDVDILAALNIGYRAFANCENMITVQMGRNLKEIGSYAFSGCDRLISVYIPSGVERIKRNAFANCTRINRLTIDNAATTIESGAFTNCQSLTDVELGENITVIDEYAFSNCRSLVEINIPQSVDEIKEGAFSNCYQLEKIVFSNVSLIGPKAFAFCESLTIAELPERLKYIGNEAFRNCVNISSMTMPIGLQQIGKRAFYNCERLTNLTINENLKHIGDEAFVRCRSINTINWNAIECTTSKTKNVVFDYAYIPITLNIGNEVELIDSKLFSHINLKEVSIPQSVIDIGYRAFADNANLYDITITPSEYLSIDETSFNNTKWEDGQSDDIIYLDHIAYKYKGKKKPERLHFKAGTTSIAANFMKGNEALRFVIFPQSITSVGRSAFEGCINLTDVEFPDKLTFIEEKAFSHCKSMTRLTLPASLNAIGDYAFEKCENVDTIEIKSKHISIGDGVFMACNALKHAYLGDYVVSLGKNAFAYCMKLRTINSLTQTELPESLTTIKSGAFYNCRSLKNNIILPENVRRIDEYAFEGCQLISSMKLTPNLRHIAFSAFNNTNNFTSFIGSSDQFKSVNGALVSKETGNLSLCPKGISGTFVVNKSVKKIDEHAFYMCNKIDRISGMQSVEKIDDRAFSGCSDMKSIVFGKDLNKIGTDIFEGCIELNNIRIHRQNRAFKVVDGVLYNYDMTILYFCPRTKKGTFVIPRSVRKIDDYAFAYCVLLDNVIKHNKIISIGKDAFLECKNR
ncbi:MAG: leucine-rich repeat domain-containing protein [bacterium]